METLPIEIVAEIAMADVQTWARMLLVFRGLSTRYFDCLARNRWIVVEKDMWGFRKTYVNNQLHSVDDRPARTNKENYLPLDWNLLRGKKEPVGLPGFCPMVYDLWRRAKKRSTVCSNQNRQKTQRNKSKRLVK